MKILDKNVTHRNCSTEMDRLKNYTRTTLSRIYGESKRFHEYTSINEVTPIYKPKNVVLAKINQNLHHQKNQFQKFLFNKMH